MDDFYRHWTERKKSNTKKYIVGDSYKGIPRTDQTIQIRGWGYRRRLQRARGHFRESGNVLLLD